MALNPPINGEGQPMRVEGEYFAVLRKDMEIEVKIPGLAKQTAKGKLFVTTARLVFVNEKHASNSFKSFDIPLLNIYEEKFEQPIFGANYLSIKVKPLFNLIPADAQVKLWFMSGGCQKFLDIFLQILPQVRKRKNEGADPNFVRDLQNGKLSSKYAYVDPSDPSYVFVTQPAAAQNNTQMNDYYAKFPEPSPDLNYAPPVNTAPTNIQTNYQDLHQAGVNPSYGQTHQQSSFGGQGVVIGTGEATQNQNQAPAYNQYQPANQYHPGSQPQGQVGYPQFGNQYGQNVQSQQGGYQAPQDPYQQGGYQAPQDPYQQGGYQQPQDPYQQGGYQNQQQQQQQQAQPQPQPQPQQPHQPNVGYYYGYWGPQLQRNH